MKGQQKKGKYVHGVLKGEADEGGDVIYCANVEALAKLIEEMEEDAMTRRKANQGKNP